MCENVLWKRACVKESVCKNAFWAKASVGKRVGLYVKASVCVRASVWKGFVRQSVCKELLCAKTSVCKRASVCKSVCV